VLVTHRGNAAPVGVIVNRPTKAPLSRAVPDLAESPAKARTVFFGGPVSPETLVVLFRATRKPDNAIEILEGIYMSSHPEVVREVLTGEKLPTDLRIFAGHASWYPGQLENEVGRGDWQLIRADAETIFDEKPEDLWRRLDRRASTKILRAVP
jgi:putative transcriptional regulator